RVPEDRPQVELLQREQARTELALGRHSHTIAVVAERLGHTRDHADVAGAVEVPVSRRGLGVTGCDFCLERERRVDAIEDLPGGDDLVHGPGALGVEGHELDEAKADALGAPVGGEATAISRGRWARSAGPPPVMRIASNPKRSTHTRATRACSS